MKIKIMGAREHNLKGVDVEIGDGLTVVTGVSGSGKTSLVFDTLYHEARRRFLDVFSVRDQVTRLAPAEVESVTGVGPAVAVGQNLLNRNPNSTLATASGLHPFLRLLYARFGARHCPNCGASLSVMNEDEIVERLHSLAHPQTVTVSAPLVRQSKGSHRTLLKLLTKHFTPKTIIVDGKPLRRARLHPGEPHNIDVIVATLKNDSSIRQIREMVGIAASLGATAIKASYGGQQAHFSRVSACAECGTWLEDVEPVHFHRSCPFCKGRGCERCAHTGLHPKAANVRWMGSRLPELLALPAEEAQKLFAEHDAPGLPRLVSEIEKRLDALVTVGLGYVQLDRSSPSLSRGESQRVRIAVSLVNQLEDVLHVLDEPTIGQHPEDISRLLPAFRKLRGPVVYVEHDKIAASIADAAIDIGPGAGEQGGRTVFSGTPADLWKADTETGLYFSSRKRVPLLHERPHPQKFIAIRGADRNNLRSVDVSIPLGRLTVITGVSGSGKSTFVEEVLVPSLVKKRPVGCTSIEGPAIRPVVVDQTPIGKNPRSNPATYTKLSDIVRDLYAKAAALTASHFSFNRSEGACHRCKGIGAVEVKMRYLPSTWIQCSNCDGRRFSDEVLAARVQFGKRKLSIADFYGLSVSEVDSILREDMRLSVADRRAVGTMLDALVTVGLGYLPIGQPSPTLSGGEAQRIKLAKFLGKKSLTNCLLILDEPSTGLHPKDLGGLLNVLDRLVRAGGTVVVVEHNTDLIRAADWIIDLGLGAGPKGGEVIYTGPPSGLKASERSLTGHALREESHVRPKRNVRNRQASMSDHVSIRNAHAHNLKNVNVSFRKGAFTVVTGISGSGKSSLVRDVLEADAKRKFLESLSMYERQSVHEGPEAPVDSVSGLGVTVSITPGRRLYSRRSTVGIATEIWHHLAVLLASIGERKCLKCDSMMNRNEQWICLHCGAEEPLAEPRHFSPSTYTAACPKCHGVKTIQVPAPEKLIVNPDKPLCRGAMYSPGFFPKGYLCKPFNGGYYMVQAVAARYGFDPTTTPWKEMTVEAQKAFLFGDQEPLTVTFESRRRPPTIRQLTYRGFYGWVRDWDVGGTYTKTEPCDQCGGSGFRPEYLAVTLEGQNIHQLSEMPLSKLQQVLGNLPVDRLKDSPAASSLQTALKRLRFLQQVGLAYLNLNRITATLSAGEAQRIRLASLLGSGLTSLTILLDEPSRGMHPSEVKALTDVLKELRTEGNTVIAVEHDPVLIRSADEIVDVGPGAGANGGRVVAQGRLEEVAKAGTLTAKWLGREGVVLRQGQPREPRGWLTIKGARGNNLQIDTAKIPLGVLVGLCGVSGSGKSTLLIDTVGRALAPRKITTSVAHEPIEPEKYGSIEGALERTVVLDQARRGIRSPMDFLDLLGRFARIFSESGDAKAMDLGAHELGCGCTACNGTGTLRTDMGFLPDAFAPCEACKGTGLRPEALEVHVNGVSFSELGSLTIDEARCLFGKFDSTLARKLDASRDVGLGYLVLRQPGHTLSGGEIQRLQIAGELATGRAGRTLYILDEPTVGQHMEDVERLVGVLGRLVDEGHSVVVAEHSPQLLSACDWLIELGPGGGPDGGYVVAAGPPEAVAKMKTPTAPYLKEYLEGRM